MNLGNTSDEAYLKMVQESTLTDSCTIQEKASEVVPSGGTKQVWQAIPEYTDYVCYVNSDREDEKTVIVDRATEFEELTFHFKAETQVTSENRILYRGQSFEIHNVIEAVTGRPLIRVKAGLLRPQNAD